MRSSGYLATIFLMVGLATVTAAKFSGKSARTIFAAGQKWHNYETGAVLNIAKVNPDNSTIAGTYELTKEDSYSRFPFRGEFDPDGITVGWVVSYWNKEINDHALGAWAGYLKHDPNTTRYYLSMSRIIAHQSDENTTSGYGTFTLESD